MELGLRDLATESVALTRRDSIGEKRIRAMAEFIAEAQHMLEAVSSANGGRPGYRGQVEFGRRHDPLLAA
jgi:hypothetical protein